MNRTQKVLRAVTPTVMTIATVLVAAGLSSPGLASENRRQPLSQNPNDQFLPAVACNGSLYLVAWLDNRHRSGPEDIYATRVSRSGAVLDPDGIPISLGTGADRRGVSIASNGEDFLVIWQDRRDASRTGYDIYGTRVTPGGLVRDPAGWRLCAAAGDQLAPKVAFNGREYLTVWEDHRDDLPRVFGTRVRAEGAVLDGAGRELAGGAEAQIFPAIGSNGFEWLLAWQDGRELDLSGWNIYATRLDTNGVSRDPEGFAVTTQEGHQALPIIASNGRDYLVVWEDWRGLGTTGRHIYGALVNSTRPRQPRELLIGRRFSEQTAPTVAFNSGVYLTAWQDLRHSTTPAGNSDLFGVRLRPDRNILDDQELPLEISAANEYYPALAAGPEGTWLLVHQRNQNETSRVLAQVLGGPPPIITGIEPVATGVAITWTAQAGRHYRVQSAFDIAAPIWADLGATLPASGDRASFLDRTTPEERTRFYRVIAVP